ncbi:c-type cytochrome biogenesis protein CcmI [Alteromonas sp. D210916BOD_24]|uniref:c-type cytochrome biogenesis protein CcmI n=1 Tax=Alteromonas sp. D210916BOD_24 TaxID=3157618 RepID=UPI00399CE9E6
MSWAEFYLVVSGLITLVLLIIAFPWLRRKDHAKHDSLSNTQIVKQRLAELEREVQEGLISEHDKRQAVDELKLALVDESAFQAHKTGNATLPLLICGIIALASGAWVYFYVNQMEKVAQGADAISALPQLSQQLANGNASNLTQQDIVQLALAIRQRLRQAPDDDTGWMYFGRLMLSLGQEIQAIEAMDKAVSLSPDKSANRITLAQALMTTADVNNLKRAQGLLLGLLNDNPQNDNLALMMAVVSAQLGDLNNTKRFYSQVEGKLPSDSDVAKRLVSRIEELEQQSITVGAQTEQPASQLSQVNQKRAENASDALTGFTVSVSLSEDALAHAPTEGFLIVFAQDANSQNKMPAAVVKMPIQGFPVSVELTTRNAMMPQYTLASLSQVTITARLSIDGDVAPAKGEWQGNTQVAVRQGDLTSISVIIDKEL